MRPFRFGPRAVPLAGAAVLGAAAAYVAAVPPGEPVRYPPCPVLRHTGLLCPGCGGLRAAHALLHGHLGTAAGANALVVAGVVVLAVLGARWLLRPDRPPVPRPGWAYAAGALTLLFTVARNLPAGAALAP
ncbi:DUF2752 domain-containing protein [Streptomyces sp. TRM 70351]|uniref:DUF2752 domain-containing protein n=1 Tax=Streptomyces sp. TRM 70351 TaxID=3116552 RepID=UPI002E7BA7F4|nr:DUF2752 domain-containing protein [Streptomyces sp. TRM 70351]MEE1930476.1 DUF2752 domain-containing protein [Streptomyces sp. TRM 70351]